MKQQPTIKTLTRQLERERTARKEAEHLLEEKSIALFASNSNLQQLNANKEASLHVLGSFAIAITTMVDEIDVVWYLAKEVVAKLGFIDCVVYMHDADSGAIVQTAAIAEKNPNGRQIVNPLRIPLGEGITGTVALTMETELIHDVTDDPRYISDVMEGGSEVCVPLAHAGQLIGVLDCEHPEKNHFTDADLYILKTVASYASAKIAERRAHSDALSKAQALEGRVHQLTQLKNELEIAKEKSEETSALKSKFVATISHEIRTPLTGILGSLDLLLDENLTSHAKTLVSMARSSGQMLQTLLNDVIDFARTEAGHLQLEPTIFNVRDLLASIQTFWHPHIDAHDLELNINLDFSIAAQYWGDVGRLRQIINNYVSNALKYAKSSKIVISIKHIASDDTNHLHRLKFSVRDFGPGISPVEQEKLFKVFSRLSSSRHDQGDGAGLGLAICSQLAQAMDGEVGVTSTFGEGAEFWFESNFKMVENLEGINRPVLETQNLLALPEVLGRTPRVLVAEDVQTNQTLIRLTLEKFGCNVTIVNNGIEAVESASKHAYDVIFMDIAMPVMDGITATKRIIKLVGHAAASPIFALTAHGMDEDHSEITQAGMLGIVTKPFKPKDLYNVVQQCCKNADLSKLAEPPKQETVSNNTLVNNATKSFDEDQISALLNELDHASKDMLITQTIQDLRAAHGTLKNGLEHSDIDVIGAEAHKLQSLCGTFGLLHLQKLAEQTNTVWKRHHIKDCQKYGVLLEGSLGSGIQALATYQQSLNQIEGKESNDVYPCP